MKQLNTLLTLVLLLFIVISSSACRAPGHIKAGEPSLISIGMSKPEVIKKLGKPENVTADGETETLNYLLERPWWQDKPFRVKLVGGKVESYQLIED